MSVKDGHDQKSDDEEKKDGAADTAEASHGFTMDLLS